MNGGYQDNIKNQRHLQYIAIIQIREKTHKMSELQIQRTDTTRTANCQYMEVHT